MCSIIIIIIYFLNRHYIINMWLFLFTTIAMPEFGEREIHKTLLPVHRGGWIWLCCHLVCTWVQHFGWILLISILLLYFLLKSLPHDVENKNILSTSDLRGCLGLKEMIVLSSTNSPACNLSIHSGINWILPMTTRGNNFGNKVFCFAEPRSCLVRTGREYFSFLIHRPFPT